jgi:hypothetical protein
MSSGRSLLASLLILLTALVAACGQSPEPAATPPPPPPAAPVPAPASAQPPAPSSTATPTTSPQTLSTQATSAVGGLGNDATVAPDITDADIPPQPVTPFPAARPIEIVHAVYVFAAKHPEVLNQVPCFCGCEHRGHRHNDDCFVAARDARGRPTAWEPHGVG